MKEMTDIVYCVALASLLHDIGKPLQRACKSDKSTLSDDSKGMSDLVGYQHALWTADFLFRYRNKFTELSPVKRYGFENFQKLASKHHKPDNDKPDEIIIQHADWKSAGLDRVKDENENETSRDTYIKKPLVSLFTRARIENMAAGVPCYHTLGDLHSESVFPNKDLELNTINYKNLVTSFEMDFQKISTKNPIIFLESITSLLVRYFWCVPSSTIDGFADIPLADHLITTSAIASAMVVNLEITGKKPSQQSFRLLSGDFAGIQNFIFSLSGESDRNIAKLLRGRSFLVNLYNVLAARAVTDMCGLPSINALTTAGGKFQILLPDTPLIIESVAEIKTKIEKWTFENFFGEIRIIIDNGVVFNYNEFDLENFQNVFKRASNSLNLSKTKPFAQILEKDDLWIDNKRFANFKTFKNCKICGKEPSMPDGKPGINCNDAIDFGTKLHKSKFLIIENGDGIYGLYKPTLLRDISNKTDTMVMCYQINNLEKTDNKDLWPELHYSNYVPKDSNEESCTFEDIVGQCEGEKALACLKADVDNMGLFFSEGFKDSENKSTLSISRMVSASRMVNWFFAGYLPKLLSKESQYKFIYTLFAGGDDLCLIGPWDKIISCAVGIQKEFTRYTGNTPGLSLSAGIELFKPGTPVSHAVENAESALNISKSPHNGKNKITLFGETMNWDEDLPAQLSFAENWDRFIKETANEQGENRNAMLYRFLQYHKEYRNAPENSIEKFKHRFRFVYDISRNLSPKKKDIKDWRLEKPFKDLLVTITPNMDELPTFRYLPVGLTIAAYKKRSNKLTIKEIK